MTTDSWIGPTGSSQPFGTEGASDANWSTGSVPDSSDDAVINTGSNAATIDVTGAFAEDVNSIALGSNDTLSINGGFLQTEDGSPGNNGDIYVTDDGVLSLDGGDFDSDGAVKLNGTSPRQQADIWITGTVHLSGSGSIVMQIGDIDNEIERSNSAPVVPTLVNESEDISGSGMIGVELNVFNNATIETNNASSSSPGLLDITGSVDGGIFINNGTVKADNGGVLIFGNSDDASTINNNNIVELDSTGSTTSLRIWGNVTIEPFLSGNEIIDLAGSDAIQDAITSYSPTATLTLINETLKGAGTVGDSNLTLNNGPGSVIDANNPNYALTLDTGGNRIANQGTMEATGGGFLNINSPVDNTGTITASGGDIDFNLGNPANGSTVNQGTIEAINGNFLQFIDTVVDNTGTIAANGGTVVIGAQVFESGAIDIGQNGSVWLEAETDGNIVFTGEGALEILNTKPNGDVFGNIVGGANGDTIGLDIPYSSSLTAVWNQTSASGGTLSVMNGGSTLVSLSLAGQYLNGQFSVSNNGAGNSVINIPNPLPPSGTTADMIMRDGNDGALEIYDLGDNAITAAYALSQQINSPWQIVGIGDFDGTDTSDVMVHNSATGGFEVYDTANNNMTSPVTAGQIGTSWSVAAFGDFSGNPNETDMLVDEPAGNNKLAYQVLDISNNVISAPPGGGGNVGQPGDLGFFGPIGSDWQVVGTGDFSGNPGETDVMMRDSGTGQFEVYDISHNQYTGAVTAGQTNPSWSVAAFGDFSGNPNETDMLIDEPAGNNKLAYQVLDITNNVISAPPGGGGNAGQPGDLGFIGPIGSDWQVVGTGDFSGNSGETDVMMRDTDTGAFEVYDISHNQYTGAAAVGQVGTEWSVAGIAADPPGGAPANAQLAQAMASYASPSGAMDASSPFADAAMPAAAPPPLVASNAQIPA